MTADWMVFAVAVGVALTLAALAAEHAGRMVRWPGRFVWISSIVATTVWPGAAYLAARGSTPAVSGAATAGLPFSIDVARMVPPPSAAALGPWRALNAVLLAAWVLWSGFLLIRMAATMARIARQRSGWRHDTVDGEPVRVSTDLGPAVVGVVRPEIVLPAWTLSLDAPFRALMLRHEVEHREAGDPRLLFLAATCLVLAPWNLALWYQTRRLRLAVEMDCDQRVLARHTEHDRYGRLLITIAQQQSNLPVALAPTLSEPVTHLERRIRAMMSAPKQFARLRAVGLVLAGVAAVVAACAVHTPDQVTGPEQSPAKRTAMAADSNQTYFAFQVDRQVTPTGADAPTYPALLRSAKVTGEVLAQFVVTTDGRANMSTFKILKSSHELFTQAVQNWLSGQTFTPAEIR
ncbi:MAG: M56 family metallopeptidase, partial [Gemmatimonadaceae bacterium]